MEIIMLIHNGIKIENEKYKHIFENLLDKKMDIITGESKKNLYYTLILKAILLQV